MSYKFFNPLTDVTSEKSEVYEVIPVSGSLFSASTGADQPPGNWKVFWNQIKSGSISGSFFNTVYDTAISSIYASALFDITFGFSVSSSFYSMSNVFLKNEKNRIYKEFAEELLGDKDGIFTWNGVQQNELLFLSFKRSVAKDKVRRGNVTVALSFYEDDVTENILTDAGAASYYFKSLGGEYMFLTSSNADSYCTPGCAWYDAKVVALSPSGAFNLPFDGPLSGSAGSAFKNYDETVVSGTIDSIAHSFAGWFLCTDSYPNALILHNVTNIFSRIYFCRGTHREFNYSSNPTAVDSEGRIRITSGSLGTRSRVYVTGVGLYGVNNELLAVAKLSNPIKKDSASEVTIRCRLLY